eukprot:365083-Chlamydomonas_euryale.AAC.41
MTVKMKKKSAATSTTLPTAGMARKSASTTTVTPSSRDAMRSMRSARTARRLDSHSSSVETPAVSVATTVMETSRRQKSKTFHGWRR